EEIVAEMREELNVKRFEVVDSLEGLLSYRVTPVFAKLGPRLGKSVQRVKALLETVDGSDVRRAFDETGSFTLDVDGTAVTRSPPTASRSAPNSTEASRPPKTAVTRSRSTSRSTTRSAPKAWRAN